MLKSLSISNYTIIDFLEVEFSSGMNVITGETGAGKSILLGAFSLVLGERADSKVLLNLAKKCVVEAHFLVDASFIKEFEKAEFDIDSSIILRREISTTGKSRSFINDTPVTLHQLKLVGEMLVNMHSQHETLDLIERGFQLTILDSYAGLKEKVKTFREQFNAYKFEIKKRDELKLKAQRMNQEEDYLKFQLDELDQAQLLSGEQESLEEEQKMLAHAEDTKLGIKKAIHIIEGGEVSLNALLMECLAALRPLIAYNKGISAQYNRLISLVEELKDIQNEVEHLSDFAESNPERLDEINQRLHLILKLQKRHGVQSIVELLNIKQEFEQKLLSQTIGNEEIEDLEKNIQKRFKVLSNLANELHKIRMESSVEAAGKVQQLLHQIGMPSATFTISISELDKDRMYEYGTSDIRFMFSANKGFSPKPLKDVASGGELSRLMLSIKTLLANAEHTPTMIFDEIDTGISGEVALRVGDIMKNLSLYHQIICITHLPQIARAGDSHFYVFKEHSGERTATKIRLLDKEAREQELAKMIGGEQYSESALLHARELIKG